ncbi:nucleotidyl transferase AbiEii/AbiGii toxin family protein [Gordonia alkaliphila]|nr:nucleotidyl transferase AbiEii/AbiGii toxin family protein [Gordonia alkaliphila]
MRYGEYRESAVVDFLVSDRAGYGAVREAVHHRNSIDALTTSPVRELRTPKTDQYGIRTFVEIDGVPIKFELVVEGHIDLEAPGAGDVVCGVRTLTVLDAAATKLLANSDRWADRSVFSRDIIDLAMMDLSEDVLDAAIEKAAAVYHSSVVTDLNRAIGYLADNPQRLETCMAALQMDQVSPAEVWDRIFRLRR